MRVLELPPDPSPAFAALLPVHGSSGDNRDVCGHGDILLTRKRTAAALILPPHKHPTRGSAHVTQAGSIVPGGVGTEQHFANRSSSPDLCKSYRLVEPSCKAVSFGTAPRWKDHSQDVAGSGGLVTSTQVTSRRTGSRRTTCEAAAADDATEPYSAEWWLLRTAAAGDDASSKPCAGSSSSSFGRLRRGSKDSSSGSTACPLVQAPLYAGAGGQALQSAAVMAVASMQDVSGRGSADQQSSLQPPTAEAASLQQAASSSKPQQRRGCTSGHASRESGGGGRGVSVMVDEAAAAAAATLPRSRCVLFPKARRFSDQQQQQQQQQQEQHHTAEKLNKLEPAAADAAAASSRQGQRVDLVKHRVPSVCFARPSVRQQMQQLLEQRRRDREAAKAAKAAATSAAPAPEAAPAPAVYEGSHDGPSGRNELLGEVAGSEHHSPPCADADIGAEQLPQVGVACEGSRHESDACRRGVIAGQTKEMQTIDVDKQGSFVTSMQQQQQHLQLQDKEQQQQQEAAAVAIDVDKAEAQVTGSSSQQLVADGNQSVVSDLDQEREQQLEQQQEEDQQQEQGQDHEQTDEPQELQQQEHAGGQDTEQEQVQAPPPPPPPQQQQQQEEEVEEGDQREETQDEEACQEVSAPCCVQEEAMCWTSAAAYTISPEPGTESGEPNPWRMCSGSSSTFNLGSCHTRTVLAATSAATGMRPTTGHRSSRSPGTAAALLGPGSFAPDDLQLSYRRRSSAWSFGSTPRECGGSSSSRSPRREARCPSTSPLRSSVLLGSPLRGSSSSNARTSPLRAAAGARSVTLPEDAFEAHQSSRDDGWVPGQEDSRADPHPQEHHQGSSSNSSSKVQRGSALADGASSWTFADVSAAERLVRKRVPGPIILPPHGSSRSAGRVGGQSVTGLPLDRQSASQGGEGTTAAGVAAHPDGSGGGGDQGCISSGAGSLLQPSWTLVEPRVRGVPIMRPPVHVPAVSEPAQVAQGVPQACDPWQLDAAIRSSKPSWSFPKAPLVSALQQHPHGAGDSRPLVLLNVEDDLLHPRRGLGVLAFGLGTSRWCGDTRSTDRAACITVYDVEAAWAYLSKHAPGLNMALSSGRHQSGAMPTSAATALGGAMELAAEQGVDLSPLSLEQLAAAVAATKPRAPVWSWGPVALVRPRPVPGTGPTCWGQAQFYDVSWVLVRKRAAGCVPFSVQVSRPEAGQVSYTAAAGLGPGAYEPCYTQTERQTALQVLSFLHMLGRQDLVAAHQSSDAGDTSSGTGVDLVTATDAWLRPRTKGYVDMHKALSREAAEQLQAGSRLLTSQIPLPDADLGDVVRPRVPQVHIVETDLAEADMRLDPSSILGPGYYTPTEPSIATAAAAAAPDFSRTTGRCGACPVTLQATAAATAGADSASSSSLTPNLRTLADWFASRRTAAAQPVSVLEPQWQAVKPTPPRAFIQPLPKHSAPVPLESEEQVQQQDAGAVLEAEQGGGVAPAKGCLDWSRMTGRKPVEAVCAAPHADYRVEDIPLTLLAQHMSAAKAPAFATMTGRPDPAAAKQLQADRADAMAIGATHDQAAAWLAATRGRALAAAAGAGPCMGKQVGRQHQVDAEGAVISTHQAEDGAWVDYNPRWHAVKPRVGGTVLFDLQVDRQVAAQVVPGAGPNYDADTW